MTSEQMKERRAAISQKRMNDIRENLAAIKCTKRDCPKHGIKNRILIRFNTKFEEDTQKRKWRVLVDGVES